MDIASILEARAKHTRGPIEITRKEARAYVKLGAATAIYTGLNRPSTRLEDYTRLEWSGRLLVVT